VSCLCDFYPGICLTTEEKARENLSQGKKNLSQVKKILSQSTVYTLPKHPHNSKPSQTHTLQNPHILYNQKSSEYSRHKFNIFLNTFQYLIGKTQRCSGDRNITPPWLLRNDKNQRHMTKLLLGIAGSLVQHRNQELFCRAKKL
jgi:hypothetical protein